MASNSSAFEQPLRQFTFISDGRLQEAPKMMQLLRFLAPMKWNDQCLDLLQRFLADDSLYALPVIDDTGKPYALMDRKRFVEFFSKPYCREIFGHRPVHELLASKFYDSLTPLIVEDTCSVEDAAQIIINADIQHMATGFIVSSQGRYLGIANGHDLLNVITQRKQAELYYLAHYDALSGLPNRTLFNDRLEQACRHAERKGRLVALLFVDVDRFKQINDSLGHGFGDAVLRTMADRLKAAARRTDTVARLGGDEFAILMEDLEDPEHVDAVAQRVVNAMREPIELLGHSLVVTVSVGSALYPSDDTGISPLLAKADAAMYEAKSYGRNGYRKYTPDTTVYDPASKLLENELRQAIENDELVLHFQPQIALTGQQVCGVEALVRWLHPQRGLVSPAHFIPVAEETGLIVPLGAWVMRHAFRQLRVWQDEGLPPLRLSVNISALQFRQPDFTEFLEHCLAEYGVNAHLIELELTESLLIQNIDDVLHTLQQIKRLGCKLAIDDFGTGFSSLSYLSRFPIDRLKIDQSFVRHIERSVTNESIARAIVALAKSLSLGIVAEGIETPAEHAVLENLCCTEGQGFLFGKPMTAADFVRWLADWHGSRRKDLFDPPPAGLVMPEPNFSAASAF